MDHLRGFAQIGGWGVWHYDAIGMWFRVYIVQRKKGKKNKSFVWKLMEKGIEEIAIMVSGLDYLKMQV